MASFKEFTVIVERDEDGYYVATVAKLPGYHTQAKTLEELMERVEEAVKLYLETVGIPQVEVRKIRVKV